MTSAIRSTTRQGLSRRATVGRVDLPKPYVYGDGSIHYPQRPLIVVGCPVRLPVIEPNLVTVLTLPGRVS